MDVPAGAAPADDALVIAGQRLGSRLILGTGGAHSLVALERAIRASGTELVATGGTPAVMAPFAPSRFTAAPEEEEGKES